MRYGVAVPNFGQFADPGAALSLAKLANERGWDGFFFWDHAIWIPRFKLEVFDPWLMLAAVALVTNERPPEIERDLLRIGTLVTPLARRKPAEVARQVATLDHLSGGRVTFGVGLGGPKDELEALGEATSQRMRAALLDESLKILDELWTGHAVSAGAPYNYRDLQQPMLPLQQPVPIWGGGYYEGNPGTQLLARTARLQGAVLLGIDKTRERRDDGNIQVLGSPRALTAEEFEQVVDEVGALRDARGFRTPYDFVIWNDRDDANPIEYEQRGATWWIEAPRRGQVPETAFHFIEQLLADGPPAH